MRRIISILFLLIIFGTFNLRGAEVDSIVKNVLFYAPLYETLVTDYKAELYVKNRVYVRKRNHLIRFFPSMFRLKKDVKEYIMESYSDLHYTAPNIYDQKVKASTGTVEGFRGSNSGVMEYFHINVYGTSFLNSKLISPVSSVGPKHYKYRIDSIIKYEGDTLYRISFTPLNNSYQLVKGYMIISNQVWSIREIQFSGRSEYLHFDNLIKMGEVGENDEFLPVRCDMNATFRLLGNVVDASYTGIYNYTNIEINETLRKPKKQAKKQKEYDLTESFTLKCDTSVSHYVNALKFADIRPFELSSHELEIYREYYIKKDSIGMSLPPGKKTKVFWGEVGDMLVRNYTLELDRLGSVKFSPLINPLLMSYSGKDGFSYKQEFKYNRLFRGDRLLRVVPRIGYNFKRKEFYWNVKTDFDYWPRKRAALHLNIGNGNRIYSSVVLDELEAMPDSIFDFDKIHLEYFRDFVVELRHSLEIFNGVSVDVGISVHKRMANKKSEFVPVSTDEEKQQEAESILKETEFLDKFRNTYISFAPRVRVSWTPGQYYYMNGDRKINVHSEYPTFTLDWERGIKGIFGSSGKYERFEFDMQHQISLGLMRKLFYRAGCGVFTNQEQLYFVDFANFSKNNLPIGWNDEIGGVFQILDRRWYNSSRHYIRGNMTYEAPFLLLPLLFKNTKFVLNERLYFGALVVPHLQPYIELGYGIGTHIFDIGVFASNINGKFSEFGFKFTFELFNR